jgi:ribosome recycling factor
MQDNINNFKQKISRLISDFKEGLKSVRANRPSAAMVENLEVDYYGTKTPLNHLASIQIRPPREIIIQVWDGDAVKSVSDVINSSDLGFTANTEGNVIKVFIPELSRERREELIKYIKNQVEEYRINIRNLRDEVNKEIDAREKSGEITEDDKFRFKKEIQEETEKANKEIEEVFENKKEEISL